MAKISINAIPDEVSAGNTVNNQLILPEEYDKHVSERLVAKLTVTGGPIKFNVIGSAELSNLEVNDGESVTLTILGGARINFIQTANSDSFKIEI